MRYAIDNVMHPAISATYGSNVYLRFWNASTNGGVSGYFGNRNQKVLPKAAICPEGRRLAGDNTDVNGSEYGNSSYGVNARYINSSGTTSRFDSIKKTTRRMILAEMGEGAVLVPASPIPYPYYEILSSTWYYVALRHNGRKPLTSSTSAGASYFANGNLCSNLAFADGHVAPHPLKKIPPNTVQANDIDNYFHD